MLGRSGEMMRMPSFACWLVSQLRRPRELGCRARSPAPHCVTNFVKATTVNHPGESIFCQHITPGRLPLELQAPIL
jgi:hypothetical protein